MSLHCQTKQRGRLRRLARKARAWLLLSAKRVTANDNCRLWLRAALQPITALGLATIVVAWTGIVIHLSIEERSVLQGAKQDTSNLARVFAEQIVRSVEQVDKILLSLRAAYAKNPEQFNIEDARIYRSETIAQISVIGADGFLQASTLTPPPGPRIDLSDREHFRVHMNTDKDALFIGKPVIGRTAGKLSIWLSRRLSNPDGSFAGAIIAAIDPSSLTRFYNSIDVGKDGTIAVIGLDKVFRAARGFKNVKPDGYYGNLPLFDKVKESPTGFDLNRGNIDGIRRLVSYRKIEPLPLIVTVGLAEHEVFADYWRNRRVRYIGAAAVTLVALLLIGFGVRRERKLAETTSEMQRAQEALAQSQERYTLVEAAVNDGIWDWYVLTGEAFLSPRWKSILGYADDELPNLAASFFDRLHPDDKAVVIEAHRAHLEEYKPYTLDFRLRCKDGGYRWVHGRGNALRDAKGRAVRMLGTVTDITERKLAAVQIGESRDNLARAEAMALLGHYKYENGPAKYTWSEGVYRILGKSPGVFTPTLNGVLNLVHPADRPAVQQYRCDLDAGLEVPRLTLRMIKDDGQIIDVEVWSTPIRARDGTVTGMFGTIQDITARKQAEAVIEESRQNLARAEAMALLGHTKFERVSGKYTWSAGVYRIMGKSPTSFIPTPENALELIHPDDRAAHAKYRQDVMAGIEVPRQTVRAVLDDGRTIYVEFWAEAVRGSDGTVTEKFSTLQDVTVRRQAEAVLAQTNKELETRVAQRTAELAHQMRRNEEARTTLAQAQKMEAVGQLTAGIAHDFNNLLAVIGGSLGFVEEAAARGLTAEPELIDAALRATRRGRELVRRLLAFSRRSPLKAEPTMIDQVVLDMLRLLQRTLGQNVDIVTHLDTTAAVVCVDRNQLANTLLNLALNARDAMPEGGQLTIATTCQPAQWAAAEGSSRWPTGDEVCITIRDTGVGMTEEVRSRAFEPFFTTKMDGLGSGLGLSMVHGFVQQSGGHIEIDAVAGRGTTITIRLPRIASACQAGEVETAVQPSARGRQKTVLLVEDDPDVRIVTAAQLRQLGYKVHAVANGMEAIDVIASPADIDITLTDVVLPGGIDGVALVKEAMQARPRMGVLCMSGYDPTQKNRKWLKVQNIDFLEKPFSSSRLAQALDAVLAS